MFNSMVGLSLIPHVISEHPLAVEVKDVLDLVMNHRFVMDREWGTVS